MTNKHIFLDVDGVLNCNTDWAEQAILGHPQNGKRRGEFLNRGKLALLKCILDETGAKIIFSSTWRHHYTFEEFCQAMRERGCVIPVETFVDITPAKLSNSHRGLEISWYLDDKPLPHDSYIILDDSFTVGALHTDTHNIKDRWIQTDEDVGLTVKLAQKAIDMLGRTPEKQKEFEEAHKRTMEALACLI